ncbi:hypothetical protein ACIQWL_50725 [Streptomyces mirabilis]
MQEAAGPVMTQHVGEALGLDTEVRGALEPLRAKLTKLADRGRLRPAAEASRREVHRPTVSVTAWCRAAVELVRPKPKSLPGAPSPLSPGVVCRCRLTLSTRTLTHVADLLRRHLKAIRSRRRALPPGKIALIVLAVLRHNPRPADMAGGNNSSGTTVP